VNNGGSQRRRRCKRWRRCKTSIGGAEVGSKVQDFSVNGVKGKMDLKKFIKDKMVFSIYNGGA